MNIFLAVPHYGPVEPELVDDLLASSTRTDANVHLAKRGGSLLARNFNDLWCEALNQRAELGLTHFVMHHADISTEPGWLDKLLSVHEKSGADMTGVVVPIKDPRGVTSTGYRTYGQVECDCGRWPKCWRCKGTGSYRDYYDVTRFTMKEVQKFPETFDINQAGKPGTALMLNTGLWVCDFTKPWVEEVYFHIADRIRRDPSTGRFQPCVLSEDWFFSTMCHERGLRLVATRAVKATHYGRFGFANDSPWGKWETDQGDAA